MLVHLPAKSIFPSTIEQRAGADVHNPIYFDVMLPLAYKIFEYIQ